MRLTSNIIDIWARAGISLSRRLNCLEQTACATDLLGNGVCTCNRNDICAGIVLYALNERRSHSINQVVSNQRGQNLPAQSVAGNKFAVTFAQDGREIANRVDNQEVFQR